MFEFTTTRWGGARWPRFALRATRGTRSYRTIALTLCKERMSVLTINTRMQFEEWLGDNADFSDARVLSLSPVPRADPSYLPPDVTIVLAYQIKGDIGGQI